MTRAGEEGVFLNLTSILGAYYRVYCPRLPDVGRVCPSLAEFPPKLARSRPTLPEVGRVLSLSLRSHQSIARRYRIAQSDLFFSLSLSLVKITPVLT